MGAFPFRASQRRTNKLDDRNPTALREHREASEDDIVQELELSVEYGHHYLRRSHSLGTTDADFKGPPLASDLMQISAKRPISCPPVAKDSTAQPL